MIPTDIKSRTDFIKFIELLLEDYKANPEEWENRDLESFLEALGRYSEDVDGYYKNFGINVDLENTNWRVFADILRGATVYE